MPSTPFSALMSENQIADLAEASVAELAGRLAMRAFRPLPAPAGAGPVDAAGADRWEAREQGDALTRLHALTHLRRAVDRLADREAANAVRSGAGYPQLGVACEISRQGARRRWPGLVTAPPHRPATDRSS
ncbi:hypothetical protein [Kitasatospora mediocidica]|uniref:hypothetical protein n=1 Tax=Kitasatospora mediocidica TaxID=58352 RepID=UPI00069100A8|nr:hypothetical protein [Kitasatospora mediocidica]